MAQIRKIEITITDTEVNPPVVSAKLQLVIAGQIIKHEFSPTLPEARIAQLDALMALVRANITEAIREELVLKSDATPEPPIPGAPA